MKRVLISLLTHLFLLAVLSPLTLQTGGGRCVVEAGVAGQQSQQQQSNSGSTPGPPLFTRPLPHSMTHASQHGNGREWAT